LANQRGEEKSENYQTGGEGKIGESFLPIKKRKKLMTIKKKGGRVFARG